VNMPIRQRKPNEFVQQITPLLLLGIGLVTTNRSVTFIEDEATILDLATRPVRQTLAQFSSGQTTPYSHPPLFDLLLHFWLRWTGGSFDYLRIPSILLFMAGLFLLGRVGRHLTGRSGGSAVTWVGALWPYGFHFGRLAVWYSCSFFLVSGLTLAYLKYAEERTTARWTAMFLFSLGLIWTSYFGWAILACLAIDLILRFRNAKFAWGIGMLAGTAALLVVAFLPALPAFRYSLGSDMKVPHHVLSIAANAAFTVYSVFVSESVAPWHWALSIPAAIGMLLCVALVVWFSPSSARRFVFYAASLMAVMAFVGILNTKRVMILTPWILLPVGVAIEAAKPRWATFSLAAALFAIGGIGWYGIYARRYYSAPRFIEPWQDVAADAAGQIRNGATVIADHPSFRLYLTYDLQAPRQAGPWRFEGLVPDPVPYPNVFLPEGWVAAGYPINRKMILIRGGNDPGGNMPIDEAARRLDQACSSISSRLRMRDDGYKWKQRFFPELGEPLWRIEIREYECGSSSSQEIYHVPAP
jgi:hypothetical protein